MKHVVLIGLAFASVSCLPLTREGALVAVVTTPEVLGDCAAVGAVSGHGSGSAGVAIGAPRSTAMYTTPGTTAREEAEVRLRNQAGTFGATHVLVTETRDSFGATDLTGQAYRCPTGTPRVAQAAPARAPVGCGKDTDCKGDRVCVKGECVDPLPR